MIRVESLGSIWVIDEGAKRYARFPKTEAGRERPEWGDERAGTLRDAVWHEFDEWQIVEVDVPPFDQRGPMLEILKFDNGRPIGMVNAPHSKIVT